MQKYLLLIMAFLALSGIAHSQVNSDLDFSEQTEEMSGEPPSTPAGDQAKAAQKQGGVENIGEPNSELQTAGQVVWVKGVMKASYPDQAPRNLARGSAIFEKDTIITDEASTGEIAFTDNTLVSLRPNSTFVIEQYHFEEKRPAAGQYFMNLLKGGFRTITGFIAKARPDNYQVKTPVATIGVRGTTYHANCERQQCAVGLDQGRGVAVGNAGGTVILTPDARYALITGPDVKPALTNIAPAILGRPPIVTPTIGPPPPGSNPPPHSGGAAGNCGILIQ